LRGERGAVEDAPVNTPIGVLVADDQPLARAGFRSILSAAPGIAVLGEAADGEEAVEQALRLRPDVVLMDIQMPKLDGIEATRRLPGQKVIVLTTFGLDDYIVDALRAGAAGFLLKDAPVEELIGAVRAVAGGDAQLSPAVTRRLLDRVAGRLPTPVRSESDAIKSLTPRELEVLAMLAAGRSNAEIATDLFISEATVKTHVSSVLAKLGLRSRIQAVIFAYESGLITPGTPRP
jgi:DNA-binding NarL/FixJ family response regulator